MEAYIKPLMTAAAFFPVAAFFITGPFVLAQYHKFGSVSFGKALILYSFVLYFLCAYFLVILPLPDKAAVAALTTPRCQLIPFHFIADIFRENPLVITDPSTYKAALLDGTVLVPFFNILLTAPFAVYLRYYFKTSFKITLLCTFALSLFFELTQLSGLYFIYPRGYRLFDVDDLFLNTLGGAVGYLCAAPIIKLLPSREKLEAISKTRAVRVTGLRRTLAFGIDFSACAAFACTTYLAYRVPVFFTVCASAYFIVFFAVIPYFLGGRTLGEKFMNLHVTDCGGREDYASYARRIAGFLLTYIAVPVMVAVMISVAGFSAPVRESLLRMLTAVSSLVLICALGKYLFTDKPLFFEKLSNTRLVSTIL